MKDKSRSTPRLSRRGFVAAGALAAAPQRAAAHEPVLFSQRHAELATALADAIVPPDDEFPGAGQAGFVTYIDRQLKGPLARFSPFYQLGLLALDETARRLTGKGFLELSDGERTALLKTCEDCEAEGPEWPEFTA